MRLITAISFTFFILCTTRALPLPVLELSFERALLGRYSPTGLIGREIHNADFNNAGGPPQTVNSGSNSQDPNAVSQPQHPSGSSGTQTKPGSPQQDNQSQSNSPPNVKAARSESEMRNSRFYARKFHTIKSGDRRHSVKVRALAADRQGVVPKHGHGKHTAKSNSHHSVTISSRKVTHQDPYSGDEKQATPPPSTTSSNIPGSPPMMGINALSLRNRYENSGANSNGINNYGDEKSIHAAGSLSKGIKVNEALADKGAPNSPLFCAPLDSHQAV